MYGLFNFVFFASVVCLLGKEIEPKSEIRFGWGMSFEYHGQMLHGLNRYYLMVGIHIPELRIVMSNFFTFRGSSCVSVDSLLYAQLIICEQYGTNASSYMLDTTFIACSYNVEFLLLKLLRA